LTFASGSKLSRIERQAFLECTSLQSVILPASVELLGSRVFANCRSLARMEFESGSKLRQIDCEAFAGCSSLRSIYIPASVLVLQERCFHACISLESIAFESPSQLFHIRPGVFYDCRSLKSICIPGSVTMFPDMGFAGCYSLSLLTFESSTHLQSFSNYLPAYGAWIDVPNSVKYISCNLPLNSGHRTVLNFGVESELKELYLHDSFSRQEAAFVRFSEPILKRFRYSSKLCPKFLPWAADPAQTAHWEM
jgi:hypothetical protein